MCFPFCWGLLLGSCCVAAAADASAMQRHYYYTDGKRIAITSEISPILSCLFPFQEFYLPSIFLPFLSFMFPGGQVVYIRGHASSLGVEPRVVYVVKAEPLGEHVK